MIIFLNAVAAYDKISDEKGNTFPCYHAQLI